MYFTVFIPTGNRAQSLDKLLKSFISQTYKDFELIIVSYGQDPKTEDVINKYKIKLNLNHLVQKEIGLTNAANLALKEAKGSIFVRTDDDVILTPTWLEEIKKTFQDPKIGGVTGPSIIPEKYLSNRDVLIFLRNLRSQNYFWRFIGKIYTQYFMEGQPFRVDHWFTSGAFSFGACYKKSLKEKFQTVTNLEPCNYSVRTELLREINGFDPIYKGVGEYHEADAAFKISNKGYLLVFNPKVVINHYPSRDGVFNNRSQSFSRMTNFVVFYLRFLKSANPFYILRFLLYVAFLECYYIYASVKYRQISQLGAMPGFFNGLIQYYL